MPENFDDTEGSGCPICGGESCTPPYRGPGLQYIRLSDHDPADDEAAMPLYTLPERMYLNQARDRVVPGDSAEAFYQLGPAGHQIPQEEAVRLGLMDAPPPPPPRAQVPAYPVPAADELDLSDEDDETDVTMELDQVEEPQVEEASQHEMAVEPPETKDIQGPPERKDVAGPPRRSHHAATPRPRAPRGKASS